MNTSHWCFTDSIGCMHRSELRTSMPCWCTSVSVASRRPTWLMICSQSLNFQVDDAYGHHRPRSALAVLWTRLRTIGDRAFPIAAATTWNSLPPEVTSSRTLSSLKSKLKTYLFKLSFPHSDSVKWLRCCCTMHLKFYIISYHIIYFVDHYCVHCVSRILILRFVLMCNWITV